MKKLKHNISGTVSGRFRCSGPNLQTIPRSFDYGKMEAGVMVIVNACFPGADGIGPDVDWKVIDKKIEEKLKK